MLDALSDEFISKFYIDKIRTETKSQNTLKEYKNMSKRYSIADQTKEGLFNEAFIGFLRWALITREHIPLTILKNQIELQKLMYDKLESLPYKFRWYIEGGNDNSEKTNK